MLPPIWPRRALWRPGSPRADKPRKGAGAEDCRRVERRKRIVDERIKALGAAIREARMKRGLSQTELAAMIGTDQAAISRIENGGCGVGIASYIKIADALGVKLGTLVGF